MREFVRGSGEGAQFWNIELKGTTVSVVYGHTGTAGRRQVWQYATAERAAAEHDRKVRAKQQDGYVEVGKESAPPLRRALEDALAEDPDNLANRMAYADWLTEQGDSRGEFAHVQMRLEDASLDAEERQRLQARERDLLKRHAADWLGDLHSLLIDTGIGDVRFARGWLDALTVRTLTRQLAGVLASSPHVRLLRKLNVDALNSRPEVGGSALAPLALSAYLGNVRRFRLGLTPDQDAFVVNRHQDFGAGAELAEVLRKMPLLEELHVHVPVWRIEDVFGLDTLGRLRVMEYNFCQHAPLEELAGNRSLGNLTHLLIHGVPGGWDYSELSDDPMSGLGQLVNSKKLPRLTHLQLHWLWNNDAVCEEVVASGILKRLQVLDLAFGWVTDHGARVLARCRDARRLKELNLSYNALTGAGVSVLEEAGVRVVAAHQRDADDVGHPPDHEFYEGDLE